LTLGLTTWEGETMKRHTLNTMIAGTLVTILACGVAQAEDWDGVTGQAPAPDFGTDTISVPEMFGPIYMTTSRSNFVGPTITVDFDDASHHDAVNDRYAAAGIRFARDDGERVHAYNFAAVGIQTESPPMGACTSRGPGARTIGRELNILFDRDAYSVGFCIGNDLSPGTIWTVELFDAFDRPVGAVNFTVNGNRHADEYIAVQSLVAFQRARLTSPHRSLAVCVDDVAYSSTPSKVVGNP
jgi:hypothetical protein